MRLKTDAFLCYKQSRFNKDFHMAKGRTKKRWTPSPELEDRLCRLEEQLASKGIRLHYDLLEAAGLKLKGGLCKIEGEYHLFVDKRKSVEERILLLENYVDQPLPKNTS